MEYKIWENSPPLFDPEYGQEIPSLLSFSPKTVGKKKLTCIIVIPGGSYWNHSDAEGKPVAEELIKYGYHVFVLKYRVKPYKYPAMLYDIQRAVRWIRYNADNFNIDPKKIVALGFSAGGHLVTMSIEHFEKSYEPSDRIDLLSCRPDAGVLCYPVVMMKENFHPRSRLNLLGTDPTDAMINEISGELNVNEDTPPTFIWHTAGDTLVPIENSLRLTEAMHEKNIPVELHIFPTGGHGLALATKNKSASVWISLLNTWLEQTLKNSENT